MLADSILRHDLNMQNSYTPKMEPKNDGLEDDFCLFEQANLLASTWCNPKRKDMPLKLLVGT